VRTSLAAVLLFAIPFLPGANAWAEDEPAAKPAPAFGAKASASGKEKTASLPCLSGTNQTGPGGFRATYCPVKNEEYAKYQEEMRKEKVIESIADNLNALVTIPKVVTVTYGECNEVNAFYMPDKQVMVICYELVDHFYDIFKPDAKNDEELDDAVSGAIDFVTYHELGHALTHILELPITGKEEDAADQLSTFLLADGTDAGEKSVLDGARWMLLEDSQNDTDIDTLPFWDEHSLDKQRFYNLACWLYGHDSEKYGSLVEDGSLPQARAERCPAEYEQLSRSWTTLLKGHLKTEASE
jgi:hypothetical protein